MNGEQNVQGINISDYFKKKEKGLIDVAKLGKNFAVSIRKFSPDTGEEADPQVVGLTINAITAARENLQKQIDDLDAMMLDLDALSKVPIK